MIKYVSCFSDIYSLCVLSKVTWFQIMCFHVIKINFIVIRFAFVIVFQNSWCESTIFVLFYIHFINFGLFWNIKMQVALLNLCYFPGKHVSISIFSNYIGVFYHVVRHVIDFWFSNIAENNTFSFELQSSNAFVIISKGLLTVMWLFGC